MRFRDGIRSHLILSEASIASRSVQHVPKLHRSQIKIAGGEDARVEACPKESQLLFDHNRANDELGASIFWVRPDMLFGEPLEQFLAFWQTKRDGRRRGIVEILP